MLHHLDTKFYRFTKIRWYYVMGLVFVFALFMYIATTNHKVKRVSRKDSVKTILFWDSYFEEEDFKFGFGRQPFIAKCKIYNCRTTKDRNMMDLHEFDAIVFHGPDYSTKQLIKPRYRSLSQTYVFLSMEAALYRPARRLLNDFFNRTMTMRFDSDFPATYFNFYDDNGIKVAPSTNPKWLNPDMNKTLKYLPLYKAKTKPIAWFVSNCRAFSDRDEYVKELQKYIQVDIYGKCGNLVCSREDPELCHKMLQKDYYFYLAMENSICLDYITERVGYPYQYDTVPIYYGGANLTRFLPPNTYLNCLDMPPEKLAKTIQYLIDNPVEYVKYLWYKDYYYVLVEVDLPFCDLCAFLNQEHIESKEYKDIQTWWNGPKNNRTCRSFDYVFDNFFDF